MQISSLDHIVLNVQDVQRSLDFYQGCLGLAAERVDEWRRRAVSFPSVRINEATLIDLVGAVAAPGHTQNLAHFCLVTEDSELSDVAEELNSRGVVVEAGPAIRSGARGDAVSIYFRDRIRTRSKCARTHGDHWFAWRLRTPEQESEQALML